MRKERILQIVQKGEKFLVERFVFFKVLLDGCRVSLEVVNEQSEFRIILRIENIGNERTGSCYRAYRVSCISFLMKRVGRHG